MKINRTLLKLSIALLALNIAASAGLVYLKAARFPNFSDVIFAFILGANLAVYAMCAALLFLAGSAAVFMERRRVWSVRSTAINAAVSVASLLIGILLLELALRMTPIGYETYWWGEARGNKVLGEYYEYNNLGFRDVRNYSVERQANTTRIVSLGDSFTAASGIRDYRKSFNKILEEELNNGSTSASFEIINLGRNGYNTADEYDVLRSAAVQLNPDIIILNYVVNDAVDFGPDIRTRLPRLAALTEKSVLYYFVVSRLDSLLQRAGVYPTYEEYMQKVYDPANPNLRYHRLLLRDFIRVAHKGNATVLIAAFPMIYDFQNYGLRSAHEYVREIAEEENAYFLDLLPYFEQEKPDDVRLNQYDGHPNERGHRIAAEALHLEIRQILKDKNNTSFHP